MAVKAGQPQVQCDTQVSTQTYMTTATWWRSDIGLLLVDECANSDTLNEQFFREMTHSLCGEASDAMINTTFRCVENI